MNKPNATFTKKSKPTATFTRKTDSPRPTSHFAPLNTIAKKKKFPKEEYV